MDPTTTTVVLATSNQTENSVKPRRDSSNKNHSHALLQTPSTVFLKAQITKAKQYQQARDVPAAIHRSVFSPSYKVAALRRNTIDSIATHVRT